MEGLFPHTKEKLIGKKIPITRHEELGSAAISMLIKYRRLSMTVEAIALALYCKNKKILSTHYLRKRIEVFAREDGNIDMVNYIRMGVEAGKHTSENFNKKEDGKRELYYTEADNNVFTRSVFLCAYLPKRYEINKLADMSTEGQNRIKARNEALYRLKELESNGLIAESYAIDYHTKTGRRMSNECILDERYSGNGYGNKYMELEYEKYGNLDPNRIDEELEQEAEKQKYQNF